MNNQEDNRNYPRHIRDAMNREYFPSPIRSEPEEIEEYNYDAINALSQYSIVYHGYTQPFKLNAFRIILLGIIATYSREGLLCWQSQETLSKKAGISVPTVSKNLKILEDRGLIEQCGRHFKYKSIQWKLGSEGERVMGDIQKELNRYKKVQDRHNRKRP